MLGNNVAVTLGAATGALVGRDDVGKLVEGDAVVGLEVASVGDLVSTSVGLCVGVVCGRSAGSVVEIPSGRKVGRDGVGLIGA